MLLRKRRRLERESSVDPLEAISKDPVPRRVRAQKTGARAVGASAVGALAIGALAIGALAIGRLAIGRARIRRLEIDELVVGRLRVTDSVETPGAVRAESGEAP